MRKERIGVVTSDKMQKTIVVQVRRHTLHPLYGKVIQKAVKFKVHDEKNEAKIGDRVRIVETRPLSKDKRWRLAEILSHGHLKASVDLKEEVSGIVAPPHPSRSLNVGANAPKAPAAPSKEVAK